MEKIIQKHYTDRTNGEIFAKTIKKIIDSEFGGQISLDSAFNIGLAVVEQYGNWEYNDFPFAMFNVFASVLGIQRFGELVESVVSLEGFYKVGYRILEYYHFIALKDNCIGVTKEFDLKSLLKC